MHRCVCFCDGGWFTTCVVSQSLLLTVNATKMAKLRPVFTWRWWKVTPGWIELVLGKQRFWSLKPTGALQTMLMYKASYQSCSCSHLLTLIYKQQVSLQFFFYMYIPQIADRQHTVLSPLTHLHVNYFDRLILFQVLTSAMASFLFQGMERIIK